MIDGLSLEDWHRLWDAMVRSEGHEMIVDDYLREMALRHPEQRDWTETLALRYERWEEET